MQVPNLAPQTALSIIAFLIAIKSTRVDEFRTACDAKFELSTVFKCSVELAALRKQTLAGNYGTDGEEDTL
jgi:N-alpha-acetyltransferase 15/16, NatA auxiliary subunit